MHPVWADILCSMPVRVLIADDYSAHQKLMGNIISSVGGVMTCASNGREALRLAEREEFEVVLMDMQMPELGGAAAADALIGRWRSDSRRPRIVAVTADNTPERRVLCRAIGMDGFIAKPFDVATLKCALQQVVMFGHCWPDGPSERSVDLAAFLGAAARIDFTAWAAGAPESLRVSAGDDRRLETLRGEARDLGFLKLDAALGVPRGGDVPPKQWLSRALDCLRLSLTSAREALRIEEREALAGI